MARLSSRRTQERIVDENLKRVYDEPMATDVPERFSALLDALKQQDSPKDTDP
ncbi:MAG: NepR family anti-sigma factor [Roseobacter sp.]